MEQHKAQLSKLCRTCSNFINIKQLQRAKPASEHTAAIKKLFDVDIEGDEEHIHPKLVCVNCRLKLNRVDLTVQQDVQELPVFREHSDDDCSTCNTNYRSKKTDGFFVKSPTSVKQTVIPSKEEISSTIRDLALKYSFVQLESSNDEAVVYGKTLPVNGQQIVALYLHVFKDFNWTISVLDKQVPATSSFLKDLPVKLDLESAANVIKHISTAVLCCGNGDFGDLVQRQMDKGSELKFLSKDGAVRAHIEDKLFSKMSDCNVIRSVGCDMLLTNDIYATNQRCLACKSYRSTLIAMRHMEEKKEAHPKKQFKPNVYMSREELIDKTAEQAQKLKFLQQDMKRMKSRVSQTISRDGLEVDGDLHNMLVEAADKPHEFPPATKEDGELKKSQVNALASHFHPMGTIDLSEFSKHLLSNEKFWFH